MFLPRVIPCLLLKGRGLVKTVKFKDPKYVGDPINAVKILNDKEVDELSFLDISITSENRQLQMDMIEDIASESFMPMSYGGGIRSIEQMRSVLSAGVEKVIINTAAVENAHLISRAVDLFGSQSIVVSIDVKKKLLGGYEVYTYGGRKATGLDVIQHAKNVAMLGAGEIVVNSIDRDGLMQGYDLDLIKKVSQEINIPMVACGGAGTIGHFKNAIHVGASAVAAGSMFVFHGKHKAVLISYLSREEIESLNDKI